MNLSDYVWHALFCPPNQELGMADKLWRECEIPIIVPAEKSWRPLRLGGQHTHIAQTAVFPRYLFTGFNERPNWEWLRERFPDIQGYMSFGGGPAIIKLSDMEWLMELRERLSGKEKPAPFQETVKPGDHVRIRSGHIFAGNTVIVDKVVSKEIHTFKDFLGGLVLVKISLADVEPV